MILNVWAQKHHVPKHIVDDLRATLGMLDTSVPIVDGVSEAALQGYARQFITEKLKGRAFRNNVGGLYAKDGGFVRFGLANDTPAMNARLKSSDIIGILPVTIRPDMVGQVFGQFLSWEIKQEGWVYSGKGREEAQARWINLITAMGGNAKFVSRKDLLIP